MIDAGGERRARPLLFRVEGPAPRACAVATQGGTSRPRVATSRTSTGAGPLLLRRHGRCRCASACSYGLGPTCRTRPPRVGRFGCVTSPAPPARQGVGWCSTTARAEVRGSSISPGSHPRPRARSTSTACAVMAEALVGWGPPARRRGRPGAGRAARTSMISKASPGPCSRPRHSRSPKGPATSTPGPRPSAPRTRSPPARPVRDRPVVRRPTTATPRLRHHLPWATDLRRLPLFVGLP